MLAAMPRATWSWVTRAWGSPTRRSYSSQSTYSRFRSPPHPPAHARGQPAQRHRLLGDDVEARTDRGGPVERLLERLRDVVGMDVRQEAEAEIGAAQRLAGRQRSRGAGVEVARGRDHGPARAGDVAGMQDHAGHAARQGLALQQRLDLALADAVVARPG